MSTANREIRNIFSSRRNLFLSLFVIHALIGIFYKEYAGLDIAANPGYRGWDWWWQTVPADLLLKNPFESLYYLHAQPPLFNLYGAVFFKLFPSHALEFMQYTNILLGACISGMFYLVMDSLTPHKWLSFAVALLLALDPSLFLFEAYILYDILTLFWIVASAAALALFINRGQLRFAILFALIVNCLILTRSAYHLLLAPMAVAFILIAARKERRKLLAITIAISMISGAWYVKNYVEFGFFGSSSWLGMSLWKVVENGHSEAALQGFKEQGLVEPLTVDVDIFSKPSSYRRYGYDRVESNIDVLNQDDFNNINIIEISRVHQKGALDVIAADPLAYLRSVKEAYRIFSLPSALFKHHTVNIQKMGIHADIVTRVLQGGYFFNYFGLPYGSVYYFLVPLSVIGYGLLFLYDVLRRRKRHFLHVLRNNLLGIWIAAMITYTTSVSILLEIGENDRFKFYIEHLTIILLAIVLTESLTIILRKSQKAVATIHP